MTYGPDSEAENDDLKKDPSDRVVFSHGPSSLKIIVTSLLPRNLLHRRIHKYMKTIKTTK
jgi:hypothetical protein